MLIKKNSVILIFDHTLSSIDGHSYNYIKNIFLESKKYFSKRLLFVNKDFFYEKKIFLHKHVSGYTNYFSMNILKKFFFKSFPKIQSNQNKKKKIRGIYKFFISIDYFLKLYNISKGLNKDKVNYIYLQYFDETLFYVLKLFKLFNVKNNHIKFLIITRYELEYFQIKKIKKNLINLIKSKYYSDKIYFFTDNIFLTKKNNNYLGRNIFKTLPLIIKHRYKLKKNNSSDQLFNLSSVGPMRLDKGLNFIEKVLKKYNLNKNKIKFNLQVNKTLPFNKNYFNKIISINNKPNVTLIEGPLSNKKFLNIVQNSDAVFCPYDKKKYLLSTSNIFIESLFLKTPIIFTKNTWASNLIEKYKKKKIIIGYSLIKNFKDFNKSTHYIKKNKKKISNGIKVFKKSWIEKNNYKSYFKILLDI